MSLLERLKANPLPFAELLGVDLLVAESDRVEARMVVDGDRANLNMPNGNCF